MRGNFAAFLLGAVLWGLWVLLWRGPNWPLIAAGGVFPLVIWLAHRTGRLVLAVPAGFFRADLWILFFALVGWRVVQAVFHTAFAAVTGTIRPGVLAIHVQVQTEMARLLLIWAITVTPGTIGLLVERDMLYVHCLHLPSGAVLPGLDRLQGLLKRMWG